MGNNKPRQVYTSAFKRKAIERAHTSGKSVTDRAPCGHPELGSRQGLLKYGVRQAKADGQE